MTSIETPLDDTDARDARRASVISMEWLQVAPGVWEASADLGDIGGRRRVYDCVTRFDGHNSYAPWWFEVYDGFDRVWGGAHAQALAGVRRQCAELLLGWANNPTALLADEAYRKVVSTSWPDDAGPLLICTTCHVERSLDDLDESYRSARVGDEDTHGWDHGICGLLTPGSPGGHHPFCTGTEVEYRTSTGLHVLSILRIQERHL